MPNRPLYSVVVSLHLERVMYTGRMALVYFSGEQRVPAGTKNVNVPHYTMLTTCVASRAAVFYASYKSITYSAVTDLLHRSSIVFLLLLLFCLHVARGPRLLKLLENRFRSWPQLPSVEKVTRSIFFPNSTCTQVITGQSTRINSQSQNKLYNHHLQF